MADTDLPPIAASITAADAGSISSADTALELAAILENASVGIIYTRDRIFQRCNPRSAEIFGYQPEEMIGRPASIIYTSAESYRALGEQAGPLLGSGKPFHADWEFRRRDGGLVWCRMYASAIDISHTDRGTIWVLEDITEAKRTEETLRQATAEIEAIMKNASVGIIFTRQRVICRYNQRFAEMFGFGGDTAVGMPGRTLYRSDEEYAAIGVAAGPLLSKAKPFQIEHYMRHQNGSDLWVNMIGYVIDPEHPTDGTIWLLEDRTAYKRAEQALQLAYAEQQLIFDHSVVGIAFVKNRTFQRCNRRVEEIYGYGPGELEGQSTQVTFFSEEGFRRLGEVAYTSLARGETFIQETLHRRRNGEPFWVRITGKAIDPKRPHDGSIWNYEDITAQRNAEASLRESEMLQRAILDSANLLIVSTNSAGLILSSNPAAEKISGWKANDLIGRMPHQTFLSAASIAARHEQAALTHNVQPDDEAGILFARARVGEIDEGEWTLCRPDGSTFPAQLTISALRRDRGDVQGFLLVAADITERKQTEAALVRSRDELEERVKERTALLEAEIGERRRAEERLRHIALHDALTGLPNRIQLMRNVHEACDRAGQEGRMAAVMFIDLDRFKTINDSLGHHVGDILLKKVASRLVHALRSDDTVARIGGDEFVVVTPGLEKVEDAVAVAEKILEILRPAIVIEQQHEIFVTPSIGVCLYPRDGHTPDMLLRNADTAMYRAKAAGRNTVRFFEAAMTVAAEQHFQIESALRRAIDLDEFELHYQPILSLADGRLASLEVLIRWRHPTLGLLPPLRFMSVAEESGLIVAIGQLVLTRACRQLAAWRENGLKPPPLAVNLSALQFRDPELLETIASTIAAHGIEPSAIELEITETVLMQDGEQTLQTLKRLADAGFGLTIDDFGTGYSSLAYLKRFPVKKLKIDRSFIKDMAEDSNDEAIVRTILALANTLHLDVVAEGIETRVQSESLKRFSCAFGQGFLYSRPVPAEAIVSGFLEGERQRAANGEGG